MNPKHLFVTLLVLLSVTLTVTIVDAQGPGRNPRALASSPVGTGFTYQGQLKQNGALVNGTCAFNFGLWDDPATGPQYGSTQTVGSLAVTNGLFTTPIDFGGGTTNHFTGTARYLQVAVNCGGGMTSLSPRQALTPAPYALALPGLYTTQNITSPNVIGGYSGNVITPTLVGATIGGGGAPASWCGLPCPNRAWADFATIGGGFDNTASGFAAKVGGGEVNTASNVHATVGGGGGNTASGADTTIGGGNGNFASGLLATVGGGGSNSAIGADTTIGGGRFNNASGMTATIGGGGGNTAGGDFATIGGGDGNYANGIGSTVGGGSTNYAGGNYATIGGGSLNTASGSASTVGGGEANYANGRGATIPGGEANTAVTYTLAAGHRAKANHQGAFVWGDSTNANITSTIADQFLVRASGGITMYTDSALSTGVRVFPGSGTWASVSDRNAKTNFAATDNRDILTRLSTTPIQTWNYKTQDASIRHIGPMAQDFYAAFNVGEDDKHITTIDSEGVALAAIQGLYQMVQEKDAEIQNLKHVLSEVEASQNAKSQIEIDLLNQQKVAFEARLSALEKASGVNSRTQPSDWNAAIALFIGAASVVAIQRTQKRGARKRRYFPRQT